MPKDRTRYVCQACGSAHPKWQGRCDACGEWNTLVEESAAPRGPGPAGKAPPGRGIELVGLQGQTAPPPRHLSRIAELDRVLGGGFVPGSAVLVGGDPGIGKSTILLQAAARMSEGARVLYISGEEAVEQVRLRARRLGLEGAALALAAAANLRDILATLERERGAALVIIDSIQTVWLDALDSAPGTVAQVRACAAELIRAAKGAGFALVLVGHVTKEGTLAGPRVLEHMVDATLTFEGDRGHQFRILRATKNRFGATDEIGVFEMTEQGLVEVANPSALFLAERRGHISGSAVFAGLEGTRPVLVEVQALLAPSGGGSPRRQVIGWDGGRLAMLLAVLEARCGLTLAQADVYLNIAGGLRIAEPAADLAVAAALVSALTDKPTDPDAVYFGEVGLSGEVRQVNQAEARLREAQKLGFRAAVLPRRVARGAKTPAAIPGLRLEEIGHLADLVAPFAAKSVRSPGKTSSQGAPQPPSG
jgi:DNA repair protein RadA/Sms